MNHIYKVVRNRKGQLVVTGEAAKSHTATSEKNTGYRCVQMLAAVICGLAVTQSDAGEICAYQSGTSSTSSAVGSGAIACGSNNGAPGTDSVALGHKNLA
ncbi:hypothetical protein D9K79_04465 [Acinetobacter cumulans]|jgi:hypothetical protein|uniref:ESPR domain-containing protein n=1 Tax=Acinetobacter cumulans TaxID=2136182 RepID=A0A498DBH4_9GAMM|nr:MULTISPECIES: ESPR-type extended signal peptide-containing protein [Acinetobacter]NWK74792.1 hypothetical protein [Acinetobacter sp. SwsAc6]QCO21388.1 hypothetical protein C9E88_007610 [Acinetobacter cumulans]RFS29585.1 hypothetical protein DYI81_11770 [Acinetobacter sp. SWAC5]RKG42835.1 hypothetical protein D7V51_10465 [Acinetobacter cumulans]RLL38011.1 hypothetical protein D9K80_03055 [Acinetobacter cumulans]